MLNTVEELEEIDILISPRGVERGPMVEIFAGTFDITGVAVDKAKRSTVGAKLIVFEMK